MATLTKPRGYITILCALLGGMNSFSGKAGTPSPFPYRLIRTFQQNPRTAFLFASGATSLVAAATLNAYQPSSPYLLPSLWYGASACTLGFSGLLYNYFSRKHPLQHNAPSISAPPLPSTPLRPPVPLPTPSIGVSSPQPPSPSSPTPPPQQTPNIARFPVADLTSSPDLVITSETPPVPPSPTSPPSTPHLHVEVVDLKQLNAWALSERKNLRPSTLNDWFLAYGIWDSGRTDYTLEGRRYTPPMLDPNFVTKTWQAAGTACEKHILQEFGSDCTRMESILMDNSTYLYKLLVPPTTHLYFFGDLHGDIHALLLCLKNLEKKKILTDELVVCDPNVRIIFGGDFVDRGNFGVEVTTLLAQFYVKNPQQVVLIRGNHEELETLQAQEETAKNSFMAQIKKYSPHEEIVALSPGKIPRLLAEYLASFIHMLPSAVYVGDQSIPPRTRQYLQCCHGGLEPGVDPTAWLRSSAEPTLCCLENYRTKSRTVYLEPTISPGLDDQAWLHQLTIAQLKMLKTFLQQCRTQSNLEFQAFEKWFRSSLGDHFGYRWLDFAVPGFFTRDSGQLGDPGKLSDVTKNRGIKCGSDLMRHFPEIEKKCLFAIFRAHQHNPSMAPLLSPLNRGLFVLHKNRAVASKLSGYRRPAADFPIPVITTVVAYEGTATAPSFIQFNFANHYLHHHFAAGYNEKWVESRDLRKTAQGLAQLQNQLQKYLRWKNIFTPIVSWNNAWENDEPEGA